jgi:hypothetical protein
MYVRKLMLALALMLLTLPQPLVYLCTKPSRHRR